MNVPTIGGAQGIFEIFVPGVFLLLNLVAVIYVFPLTNDETRQFLAANASNAPVVLVVAIAFGYLIGILLRLFSLASLDRDSAWWSKKFNPRSRNSENGYKQSVTEEFPYISWIGEVCTTYYGHDGEAQKFYDKVWKPRILSRRGNKPFFNHCKVLINATDEKAAREIYIAESVTRYISGMFHALAIAVIAIAITIIAQIYLSVPVTASLLILGIAYVVFIVLIVRRFRDIRIKEVETVFAASLINRKIFLPEDKTQDDKQQMP